MKCTAFLSRDKLLIKKARILKQYLQKVKHSQLFYSFNISAPSNFYSANDFGIDALSLCVKYLIKRKPIF